MFRLPALYSVPAILPAMKTDIRPAKWVPAGQPVLPTLTRHGYRLKDMVEQFDAKPAEIRALFNHQLDPTRTAELRDRILAAGLPI